MAESDPFSPFPLLTPVEPFVERDGMKIAILFAVNRGAGSAEMWVSGCIAAIRCLTPPACTQKPSDCAVVNANAAKNSATE